LRQRYPDKAVCKACLDMLATFDFTFDFTGKICSRGR
jgi:hypothetical protein